MTSLLRPQWPQPTVSQIVLGTTFLSEESLKLSFLQSRVSNLSFEKVSHPFHQDGVHSSFFYNADLMLSYAIKNLLLHQSNTLRQILYSHKPVCSTYKDYTKPSLLTCKYACWLLNNVLPKSQFTMNNWSTIFSSPFNSNQVRPIMFYGKYNQLYLAWNESHSSKSQNSWTVTRTDTIPQNLNPEFTSNRLNFLSLERKKRPGNLKFGNYCYFPLHHNNYLLIVGNNYYELLLIVEAIATAICRFQSSYF